MNINSWIIITDQRRAGGMLAAARNLGGQVTAAVVGPRALAEEISGVGFDKVLSFETEADVPAEAYAPQLAEAIAAAGPRLVISSDAPVSRVLLGAAAAKLNAALLAAVRGLKAQGEAIVASRSTGEGKVLEDVEVAGALAVIFDGEDADLKADQATPVETVALGSAPAALKLLETIDTAGGAGLLSAARVVGVGVGLSAKDDLELIAKLADSIGAETACTLPVCEDMRWFPAQKVVGSSHSQIAPNLYIAVGISGQPQHMSGIRDAKIVVAINNDPEARIFKNCNYGILGDLYKIVPALTSAFTNLG